MEHEALMGVSYTGSSTYGDGSSLVTNATANTNGYFSLYNPPPFSPPGATIPSQCDGYRGSAGGRPAAGCP